jgi:hypothetical protein
MGPETLLAYAARWEGAERRGDRVRWRDDAIDWSLRLGSYLQMNTLVIECRATYLGKLRLSLEREQGPLDLLWWRAPLPPALHDFRGKGRTDLLQRFPAFCERIAGSVLWLELRGKRGELHLNLMLSELLENEAALKQILEEVEVFFLSLRAEAAWPR